MQINFENKVAIVTGAGAGIGKEYAVELARRGAGVVVNDLGGARDGSGASHLAADWVVEEIKQAGGEALASYDSFVAMGVKKGDRVGVHLPTCPQYIIADEGILE